MGGTLLLALLVISLAVIVLGYLLSLRAQLQQRNQYTAYSADRSLPPSMISSRLRRRYESALETESTFSLSALVDGIVRPKLNNPTSLMGLGLVLITLLLFGMLILRTLLPGISTIAATLSFTQPVATAQPTPNPLQEASTASQKLVRLSQLDPAQYNSTQEYNTWAYSACSAAAMTEVINSYGHNYRITDILKVESQIGEITPQLGLLEDAGIAHTASHFGFTTIWGYQFSLNQIIDIANKGRPVIVSWPPAKYPGGHLVVVTGGNSNSVYIADSSLYDRHTLTHAQFLTWWGGFAAILIPQGK
ncbi:MAG TPA: C39 family peptidase [Ktedonobacteraceae bacterium]|nr:C39 family peptidase [Ktedonobacteraceae bacterium]